MKESRTEAEACHHVAGSESLKTDQERLLVQGQPRLQRKSQDAGDTRIVGCLPRVGHMRSRAGVSLGDKLCELRTAHLERWDCARPLESRG